MKRSTEIIIHVLFWLFYIANSMLLNDSHYVENYGMINIGVKQTTFFIIIISIFYINYIVLIPKYLSQRKYINYLSGVVTLIVFSFLLYMIQTRFLDWYFKSGDYFFNNGLLTLTYLFFQIIFYLIVSTGAKFTMDWFNNLKLKDELEREITESEIKLLKSQISPHFLFNTLNNLYSLVQRKSEHASDAVLMLSDLMRYMLKENTKEKIELVKEISYVKSFIELQRLRLSNPDIVKSEILIDNATVQISPMLLIPFVENTFKHADITSDDALIEFKLELKKNVLFFTVDNNIKERNKDDTTGVGLVNVRRRLDLLYPNKYNLLIDNDNNKFHVKLELNLNDN
jgi:two-component system, LytTR family, sensor kinase